jgi:hypothetical protein
MELEIGGEIITFPCKAWTDEKGKRWGRPTLAFLQKRGATEVIPPPPPEPTPEEIKAATIKAIELDLIVLDSQVDSRCYEDLYDFVTGATTTIGGPKSTKTVDLMAAKKAKRQELKEAKSL